MIKHVNNLCSGIKNEKESTCRRDYLLNYNTGLDDSAASTDV